MSDAKITLTIDGGQLATDTFVQVGNAVKGAGAAADASADQWKQLTAGLKSFESGAHTLGTALTVGVTAPLVAMGTAAVAASAPFEASMTRFVSLAGVTAGELDKVKTHILDLAPTVGIGPQALADAMMLVSSTVSDTGVALGILDTAAKGSAAGMGTTADVARALTAVVNSYGAANLSAARAADIMTQTVKDGGAEARELAPVLANVVPIAAQLGVSFEEVGANIATVTKLGVPASEAVTQLSSVFSALMKETKEGSEALQSVGMSYASLRAEVKDRGLMAALVDLNTRFGENKTGLTDVFGRIEALRNVMSTAGQQADTYAEVLGHIRDSAGSLDSAFEAMKGTQVQTWSEVRAQLDVVAIRFGDALAPAMVKTLESAKPLLDSVVSMARAFADLPEPVRETAIVIGGIAAAAGPAIYVLGSLAGAAGTLIKSWQGVSAGIAGMSAAGAAVTVTSDAMIVGMSASGAAAAGAATSVGVFTTALEVATGPIGWTVLAVTSLYGGFKLLQSQTWQDWSIRANAALDGLSVAETQAAVEAAHLKREMDVLAEGGKEFGKQFEAIAARDIASWTNATADASKKALALAGDLPRPTMTMIALGEKAREMSEAGTLTSNVMTEMARQAKALNIPLEEMDPVLRAIVIANNNHADAMRASTVVSGVATAAQIESKAAIKKHAEEALKNADALRDLTVAASGYGGVLDDLGDAVVEAIRYELEHKGAIEDIARVYKVAPQYIKEVSEQLKIEAALAKDVAEGQAKIAKYTQESWNLVADIVAKKLKEVNDLTVANFTAGVTAQRAFDDEMAHATLTSNEFKKRAILQQLEDQKIVLEKMGGNWEAAYATDVETARLKLAEIGTLWDDATNSWIETFDRDWAKGGMEHSMMAPLSSAKAGVDQVSVSVIGLATSFGQLGQQIGGTFGQMMTGAVSIAQAFEKMQAAQAAARAPDASASAIAAGANSKMQFGMQAAGMGAGIAAGMIDDSGQASTGSLVAKGALQGASMGAVAGPYGMAVGAGVGAIVGWVQAGKEWRQVVQDISRDFAGIKVSDDFAKMISDLEDSTGLGSAQAITTQLDQLVKMSGGLDSKNLDTFTQKLHDVFSYIEDKTLSVAQGTQILDKNFMDFAAAGTDSMGRLGDNIREIIKLNDTFGTHSQAVTAYIHQQTTIVASGFNDVVAGTEEATKGYDALKQAVVAAGNAEKAAAAKGDSSAAAEAAMDLTRALKAQHVAAEGAKQELGDLGIQAVAAFASAVASGASVAATLKTIGPSLTSLQKSYADLGMDVDNVALSNLMMQNSIAQGNPRLIAAIGGLSSEMVSLDNIGLMNVKTFAAMERTGMQMYTRLQDQVAAVGGTTIDALVPMQDYLHQAEIEARNLGVPLDDNTAELIRQSTELGIWKDAGKSANDLVIEGMTTLVGKVSELIDKLNGVTAATNAIPRDISVNVKGNYTPPDIPDYQSWDGASTGGLVTATGIQHFAAGGMVAGRGTDTVPAMLTPGELVFNKGQQNALGELLKKGGGGKDASVLHDEIKGLRGDMKRQGEQQTRLMSLLPTMIRHASRGTA